MGQAGRILGHWLWTGPEMVRRGAPRQGGCAGKRSRKFASTVLPRRGTEIPVDPSAGCGQPTAQNQPFDGPPPPASHSPKAPLTPGRYPVWSDDGRGRHTESTPSPQEEAGRRWSRKSMQGAQNPHPACVYMGRTGLGAASIMRRVPGCDSRAAMEDQPRTSMHGSSVTTKRGSNA